jgi:inosine-uridine nucleoside N-ribohydrolase
MFLVDELSGDCAFGLCALLRAHLELDGFLISYGTAPLEAALRNARDYLALANHSCIPVFSGADSPLVTPLFMNPIPRFYGLEGKVGVDFRTLTTGDIALPPEAAGTATDFFEPLRNAQKGGSLSFFAF